MKTTIELKNMHFYAYHGVLPHEKEIGNDFFVNVKFSADVTKSFESDDVKDTINYAEIYDLVKAEMSVPSNLLEHVAGRIFTGIKKSFPEIEHLEVKLSKQNPPVGGDVEASEVIVSD